MDGVVVHGGHGDLLAVQEDGIGDDGACGREPGGAGVSACLQATWGLARQITVRSSTEQYSYYGRCSGSPLKKSGLLFSNNSFPYYISLKIVYNNNRQLSVTPCACLVAYKICLVA